MGAVANHQQVHVWVDQRLHTRLVAMAKARKMTKAALVRMALQALVKGLV